MTTEDKYVEMDVMAGDLEALEGGYEIRCSDKSYIRVVYTSQEAKGRIIVSCAGHDSFCVPSKAQFHIRKKIYEQRIITNNHI